MRKSLLQIMNLFNLFNAECLRGMVILSYSAFAKLRIGYTVIPSFHYITTSVKTQAKFLVVLH